MKWTGRRDGPFVDRVFESGVRSVGVCVDVGHLSVSAGGLVIEGETGP